LSEFPSVTPQNAAGVTYRAADKNNQLNRFFIDITSRLAFPAQASMADAQQG
jgi:hypothetical protein